MLSCQVEARRYFCIAASFLSWDTVSSADRPVIRMSLRRDLWPERITTQACGSRKARAKNRTHASLACPSRGAACSSSRNSPEESLVRRSLAEHGLTFSQKLTFSRSIWNSATVSCQSSAVSSQL